MMSAGCFAAKNAYRSTYLLAAGVSVAELSLGNAGRRITSSLTAGADRQLLRTLRRFVLNVTKERETG